MGELFQPFPAVPEQLEFEPLRAVPEAHIGGFTPMGLEWLERLGPRNGSFELFELE